MSSRVQGVGLGPCEYEVWRVMACSPDSWPWCLPSGTTSDIPYMFLCVTDAQSAAKATPIPVTGDCQHSPENDTGESGQPSAPEVLIDDMIALLFAGLKV